jgi:hypothetical protein
MSLQEMARDGYGYGLWKAPYWFLGLEEGKGRNEPNDNSERVRAWSKLHKDGLSDLQDFHGEIGEEEWRKNLQPTWRPLLLLLLTSLGKPTENSDLLKYQREQWGSSQGETAIIELSGIAARSLRTKLNREEFLEERISRLREKIKEYKPKIMIMYGTTNKKHWEKIAGQKLERDSVVQDGETLIVFTPHPQSRGRKNADWVTLGKKIHKQLEII